MILELEKGSIKILKNSCEPEEKCLIHLIFKDHTLTSEDVVSLKLNGAELEMVAMNTFNLKGCLRPGKENSLKITLLSQGKETKYEKLIPVNTYISLGGIDQTSNQRFLDLETKVELLHKEIKRLERKITIF